MFSGLMNLTSSWLADEGIVVDTEGDIGHTMVMHMLNLISKGGACALGEVGSIDDMEISWHWLMKAVPHILLQKIFIKYRSHRAEREALL